MKKTKGKENILEVARHKRHIYLQTEKQLCYKVVSINDETRQGTSQRVQKQLSAFGLRPKFKSEDKKLKMHSKTKKKMTQFSTSRFVLKEMFQVKGSNPR